MGRWKAVKQKLQKGPAKIELYDLETDPSESRDVAAENPDVIAKARAIFREQRFPSQHFPIKGLDGE